MNELMDKLILRIIFSLTICFYLLLYKYAHILFYPSSRNQLLKRFYPSQNSADTLHFFGRLVGIGIVYSSLYFDLSDGMILAIISFLIKSFVAFVVYLLSLYIIESITLYNFEYSDEITKRKNICYGIITFFQSLSVSIILRVIMSSSNNSIVLILFMWLLGIVIFGFATKFYTLISKLSFNKLMIHKNLALAFSFSGYVTGTSIIISSALAQPIVNIETYMLEVILKILLSAIIFPIFQKGIVFIFKLQDDLDEAIMLNSEKDMLGPHLGYGIYEGSLLFTSSLLTSLVIRQIVFGNFYPTF
jgi:uncharacterized membrane protein YjfL (UPF0719 family)